MRRFLSILVLIVTLLTGSAARAQVVEIPVFEGGEGLQFFETCARDYERLHPGVQIQLYGDPRISDKLRIRLLEGTYPDVTNANLNYWKLLEQGHLEPLDAALNGLPYGGGGSTTWRESFLPGSLERFSVKGQTYAVPLIYTVHALWYNRALFRRQGWTPPRTWSEFFQLSLKIKAAGVAPVAFQGRYSYYAQPLIDNTFFQLAGREQFYRMKRLEAGSFLQPAMVETLRLVQRAATDCFQAGALGMSHTEAQLSFFQGNAAMIVCGSWLKGEMLGNIPEGFELGECPLPLPEGPQLEPHALLASAGYYFVFHKGQSTAEAIDFLRYLTSPQVASRFAQERDIVVAVKGANAHLSRDLQDLAQIVESSTSTFGDPPGAGFPEMAQFWADARNDLLRANKTPEQIAEFLENAARSIRNRDTDQQRYPYWGRALALVIFLAVTLLLRRNDGEPGWKPSRPQLRAPAALQFLALPLGLYAFFLLLPSGLALLASATQWDGMSAPRFTGLANLIHLLCQSDQLWRALSNNLFLMVMTPLVVLPVALFLAFSLSQRLAGWSLYRALFFFPNLLGVAGILLWQQLYNPNGGPINALLSGLGLTQFAHFPWLSQDFLYWALLPMAVWGSSGFYMLLLLAAMENVPQDLYESAELDGANEWQKFRFITLPQISPTVVVSLMFLLVGGLKAFETVWLLTNQEPTSGTHLVGTLLVQATFERFELGTATAIALILLLLAWSLSNLLSWFQPAESA